MESDDRMDGSPVLIGLLIFLVCCSAFFSASETALTSLSRIRLRNMVEENVKNADLNPAPATVVVLQFHEAPLQETAHHRCSPRESSPIFEEPLPTPISAGAGDF